MTATVETVSEQLDLASILPADRAIARSITLSDADVGKFVKYPSFGYVVINILSLPLLT